MGPATAQRLPQFPLSRPPDPSLGTLAVAPAGPTPRQNVTVTLTVSAPGVQVSESPTPWYSLATGKLTLGFSRYLIDKP